MSTCMHVLMHRKINAHFTNLILRNFSLSLICGLVIEPVKLKFRSHHQVLFPENIVPKYIILQGS